MYLGRLLFKFTIYSLAKIVHSRTLSKNLKIEKPNVCFTQDCVIAASKLLQSMDLSVDPCDDFYKFSCGNFIKTAELNGNVDEADQFRPIKKKVYQELKIELQKNVTDEDIEPFRLLKQIYGACIGQNLTWPKFITRIDSLRKDMGSWPLLEGSDWKEEENHWILTQYKLRNVGLPFNNFIDVRVDLDIKNTSRRIIWISSSKPHITTEILKTGWQGYFDRLVKLAVLHGADNVRARKEVKDVASLEANLVKIVPWKLLKDSMFKDYDIMTIKDLECKFEYVPWLRYLQTLLDVEDLKLTLDEEVAVTSTKYLHDLRYVLNKYTNRTLINYMILNTISVFYPKSTKEIGRNGSGFLKPQPNSCIENLSDGFPQALGALYVRKYFDKNSKDVAVEMVQNIKAAFLNILKISDWMDNTTENKALEKVNEMIAEVGFPTEFLDDDALEGYYCKFQLNDQDEDNYSKLFTKIFKFVFDRSFEKLKFPVNRSDWQDVPSPAEINAYYFPVKNVFHLPAAILQGVFFGRNRPNYLNYGSLGFIVGHEISHGFDSGGHQYDKNGNVMNWWKQGAREKFLEKSRCFMYQYGNYTEPNVNLKLNGTLTLAENIADNGGMRASYLAYRNWASKSGIVEESLPGLSNYTANQMFWISSAHTWCAKLSNASMREFVKYNDHSPRQFRILGSLSNSENFAEDFECPTNSRMNPAKKCKIF